MPYVARCRSVTPKNSSPSAARSTTAENHAASCSGSVSARQTFSGGCPNSLTKRIATRPSSVACTVPRSDAISGI